MAPLTAEHLKRLEAQLRRLSESVEHAVHTCHQTEAFSQISARLGNIESNVGKLLEGKGRSAIIERMITAVAVIILSAAVAMVTATAKSKRPTSENKAGLPAAAPAKAGGRP